MTSVKCVKCKVAVCRTVVLRCDRHILRTRTTVVAVGSVGRSLCIPLGLLRARVNAMLAIASTCTEIRLPRLEVYLHIPTEYPCPKGTYGARPGLGDESCSGPCAAGYDCPAASVDQYGRPSDAGLSQAVLP